MRMQRSSVPEDTWLGRGKGLVSLAHSRLAHRWMGHPWLEDVLVAYAVWTSLAGYQSTSSPTPLFSELFQVPQAVPLVWKSSWRGTPAEDWRSWPPFRRPQLEGQ